MSIKPKSVRAMQVAGGLACVRGQLAPASGGWALCFSQEDTNLQ
jgi:hypothetical protein